MPAAPTVPVPATTTPSTTTSSTLPNPPLTAEELKEKRKKTFFFLLQWALVFFGGGLPFVLLSPALMASWAVIASATVGFVVAPALMSVLVVSAFIAAPFLLYGLWKAGQAIFNSVKNNPIKIRVFTGLLFLALGVALFLFIPGLGLAALALPIAGMLIALGFFVSAFRKSGKKFSDLKAKDWLTICILAGIFLVGIACVAASVLALPAGLFAAAAIGAFFVPFVLGAVVLAGIEFGKAVIALGKSIIANPARSMFAVGLTLLTLTVALIFLFPALLLPIAIVGGILAFASFAGGLYAWLKDPKAKLSTNNMIAMAIGMGIVFGLIAGLILTNPAIIALIGVSLGTGAVVGIIALAVLGPLLILGIGLTVGRRIRDAIRDFSKSITENPIRVRLFIGLTFLALSVIAMLLMGPGLLAAPIAIAIAAASIFLGVIFLGVGIREWFKKIALSEELKRVRAVVTAFAIGLCAGALIALIAYGFPIMLGAAPLLATGILAGAIAGAVFAPLLIYGFILGAISIGKSIQEFYDRNRKKILAVLVITATLLAIAAIVAVIALLSLLLPLTAAMAIVLGAGAVFLGIAALASAFKNMSTTKKWMVGALLLGLVSGASIAALMYFSVIPVASLGALAVLGPALPVVFPVLIVILPLALLGLVYGGYKLVVSIGQKVMDFVQKVQDFGKFLSDNRTAIATVLVAAGVTAVFILGPTAFLFAPIVATAMAFAGPYIFLIIAIPFLIKFMVNNFRDLRNNHGMGVAAALFFSIPFIYPFFKLLDPIFSPIFRFLAKLGTTSTNTSTGGPAPPTTLASGPTPGPAPLGTAPVLGISPGSAKPPGRVRPPPTLVSSTSAQTNAQVSAFKHGNDTRTAKDHPELLKERENLRTPLLNDLNKAIDAAPAGVHKENLEKTRDVIQGRATNQIKRDDLKAAAMALNPSSSVNQAKANVDALRKDSQNYKRLSSASGDKKLEARTARIAAKASLSKELNDLSILLKDQDPDLSMELAQASGLSTLGHSELPIRKLDRNNINALLVRANTAAINLQNGVPPVPSKTASTPPAATLTAKTPVPPAPPVTPTATTVAVGSSTTAAIVATPSATASAPAGTVSAPGPVADKAAANKIVVEPVVDGKPALDPKDADVVVHTPSGSAKPVVPADKDLKGADASSSSSPEPASSSSSPAASSSASSSSGSSPSYSRSSSSSSLSPKPTPDAKKKEKEEKEGKEAKEGKKLSWKHKLGLAAASSYPGRKITAYVTNKNLGKERAAEAAEGAQIEMADFKLTEGEKENVMKIQNEIKKDVPEKKEPSPLRRLSTWAYNGIKNSQLSHTKEKSLEEKQKQSGQAVTSTPNAPAMN